ncbi:hypothetical protein [Profundibacter sp.]|uniref:hypothetical protein n=1 Tax=Profundibacter sp. TaxID=3101071 RepID=UPI003D11E190
MTADHPVETLGGLCVSFNLSPDQLHRVDAHQLDLQEVAGFVELKILVQLFNDAVEHDLFFRSQTAVSKDAMLEGLKVALHDFHLVFHGLGVFGFTLIPMPSV